MFLQASVILLTGGVGMSASVHAGIHPPPRADTTPGEHAGRYGQRAGGTHPTGMQSCSFSIYTTEITKFKKEKSMI